MELREYLARAYTPYQAIELGKRLLEEKGFSALRETEEWHLEAGKGYYTERGGSSLIAFRIGSGGYFKIVASHVDSPALKLKENAAMPAGVCGKWNTEKYGGGIWYTFFDRPLRIAGRVVEERDGMLCPQNVVSSFVVTIPSLAVHMNRGVNEGFAVNPQVDLLPLTGLGQTSVTEALGEANVLSYDLYAVPDVPPFDCGVKGELLSSPRLDDLVGAFGSLAALADSDGEGISVAALFDNEEVGSRTLQGAASDLLASTLSRICLALGVSEPLARAKSFLISLDSAHAEHPNHPETCDPTNRPVLGGGVVIKSHAGRAYTTDGLSSALVKALFARAGVRWQTFFNRSDAVSGGTLGAIGLGQVGILSADLGLAQLAMHSAVECIAKSDYAELEKGLRAFYRAEFRFGADGISLVLCQT